MQLRCTYCQTMFAIGREETLAALEDMDENNLKYYDAHCPKCRRANRVERFRLEFSYPAWKRDLQAMAKQAEIAAPMQTGPGTPASMPGGPALAAAPRPPSPPLKKAHVRSHTRAAVKREKAASSTVPPRQGAKKASDRKKAAVPQKGTKGLRRSARTSAKGKPAARSTGTASKARQAARSSSARGKKPAGKKKK